MNTQTQRAQTPLWFWIVAVLIIAWNIFGVMQYLGAMAATPEGLIESGYYTPEQAEAMGNIPAWSVSLFALAVFTGLGASILLVLRKAIALPVFLISLIFVILSIIGDAVLGLFSIMGGSYIGIMTMVFVVSVIQWLFARAMRAKSVLT